MKTNLSDSILLQLSEFIATRTALHFPKEQWNDLEHKTVSAAKEFGFTNEEEFVRWLVSASLTADQIEILASHLTVSETYFWREPQSFEALEGRILPELIQSRSSGERRIKIWSAGCCTGEEPYSIAIALDRLLPHDQDWGITVLATDINSRMLRKAILGVYGDWSFRNAPHWLKEKYFRSTKGGKYEILPKIREMVTFEYLNLAEDIYPSPLNNTNAVDIIFCRNVLMYFAKERALQVGYSLYNSLVDGGWLIVGSSELSPQTFSRFASVNFPGAIVYRKARPEFQQPAIVQREERFPQEHVDQRPLEALAEAGTMQPVSEIRTDATPLPALIGIRQQTVYEQTLDLQAKGVRGDVAEKFGNQESPHARGLAVWTLANKGRLSEALALCEQALAADKLDSGLHFLRATILQEQNEYDQAITSLKRALYLDPNYVLAHFAMGNLLLHQGHGRNAKKCFQNVLTILSRYRQEDILVESDGLTAGRFREIVHATMEIVP